MSSTIIFCSVLLISLFGFALSNGFYQSNGQQPANELTATYPVKNGARPSFRQYNNNYGSDYNSQQYGYSNGQYDNSQWGQQRYPQQYDSSNGFQRDPRFNGASTVGSKVPIAFCAAAVLMFFRSVLTF
ncbi:hypothetical protein M3Y94_00422200 [Aphelenchoides besseyi]|nr:hypothetical protein M3Y94_00422200 [Aphelenchoides besseyi]KAI6229555.1 hypothetical protein M3Y95_00543200 [Aphelenchoides besseyi]